MLEAATSLFKTFSPSTVFVFSDEITLLFPVTDPSLFPDPNVTPEKLDERSLSLFIVLTAFTPLSAVSFASFHFLFDTSSFSPDLAYFAISSPWSSFV